MKYYFSKTLNIAFEEGLRKVAEELKNEGFGIMAEIDVKKTLTYCEVPQIMDLFQHVRFTLADMQRREERYHNELNAEVDICR